jgi:hypothetical protein
MPSGRTLRGYCATVRGLKAGEPLFRPADRCSFVGLTFLPADRGLVFGSAEDRAANVTLSQCTIRDGSLGRWASPNVGLLVEDCKFDHAGAGPVIGGLFHRCRFDGLAPAHSFLSEGDTGPLAVLDVEFMGTDRGIILRNGWGPTTDALFAGIVFHGVSKTVNGNELVLFEGDGAKNALERLSFFHIRSYNCESNHINIDCLTRDCHFRDGVLDGGGPVIFGMNDKPVSEITVNQFEFRGCGAIFTKSASFCKLDSCAFIGWRPTRANQTWWTPEREPWYGVKGRSVIEAQGPQRGTNTVSKCVVELQPEGVSRCAGATWR